MGLFFRVPCAYLEISCMFSCKRFYLTHRFTFMSKKAAGHDMLASQFSFSHFLVYSILSYVCYYYYYYCYCYHHHYYYLILLIL